MYIKFEFVPSRPLTLAQMWCAPSTRVDASTLVGEDLGGLVAITHDADGAVRRLTWAGDARAHRLGYFWGGGTPTMYAKGWYLVGVESHSRLTCSLLESFGIRGLPVYWDAIFSGHSAEMPFAAIRQEMEALSGCSVSDVGLLPVYRHGVSGINVALWFRSDKTGVDSPIVAARAPKHIRSGAPFGVGDMHEDVMGHEVPPVCWPKSVDGWPAEWLAGLSQAARARLDAHYSDPYTLALMHAGHTLSVPYAGRSAVTLTPASEVTLASLREHYDARNDTRHPLSPLDESEPDFATYTSGSGQTTVYIYHDGERVTRVVWTGPKRSFAGGVWWLHPTWQPDGSVSLMGGADRWGVESVETTRIGDLLDRLEVPGEHRATVDAVIRERAPMPHEVPVAREPEPVWTGESVEFSRGGRRRAAQ